MYLLENHDISFRRNEFLVYDAEGHARSVPLRRSPSGHRILNLLQKGQRAASCFSHATAGDFRSERTEFKRLFSLHVWVVCILFLVFVITQILHLSLRTDHGLFRLDTVRFFFLMRTCASHLHFSPSCVPIKTRLNWLQTVIDGQKSRRTLDEMSKSHRSRTRAFAHDGRNPRSWPQTQPCRGQDVLEQSYTANQHGAWISCARCALRLHYIPRHTARMTSVSTPSSASVQEALKRMSLLRDNDFTAKAVRDMIAEVEGRKPRKKKSTPQTTIVYNTVYNSGAASSPTISSETPVRREISTPPSPQSSPITRLWRRFVVGILQKEWMRVRRENALMMGEDL